MTTDVTPSEQVTRILVDDADLLAILAQPPNEQDSTYLIQPEQALDLLLSPTLPELQSDDEGSELSLTLLDDTQPPSRKRSRDDFEEEDEDPFGFEFLDVVQLEDLAPLTKKPFVNDEELCLDFLNDDFADSNVEVFEPFTAV
jgi:hypothetical protein